MTTLIVYHLHVYRIEGYNWRLSSKKMLFLIFERKQNQDIGFMIIIVSLLIIIFISFINTVFYYNKVFNKQLCSYINRKTIFLLEALCMENDCNRRTKVLYLSMYADINRNCPAWFQNHSRCSTSFYRLQCVYLRHKQVMNIIEVANKYMAVSNGQ